MNQENNTPERPEAPDREILSSEAPGTQRPPTKPPTTLGTRILALFGAILMIILTIFFAYSIATGAIFAW